MPYFQGNIFIIDFTLADDASFYRLSAPIFAAKPLLHERHIMPGADEQDGQISTLRRYHHKHHFANASPGHAKHRESSSFLLQEKCREHLKSGRQLFPYRRLLRLYIGLPPSAAAIRRLTSH